mmetsp:Transcript_51283/g.115516  ORF Transcript_51283/g.115516 Transcript_51283/m.115516 type:complete len:689 (+) Transcript_51283:81-2147(+)
MCKGCTQLAMVRSAVLPPRQFQDENVWVETGDEADSEHENGSDADQVAKMSPSRPKKEISFTAASTTTPPGWINAESFRDDCQSGGSSPCKDAEDLPEPAPFRMNDREKSLMSVVRPPSITQRLAPDSAPPSMPHVSRDTNIVVGEKAGPSFGSLSPSPRSLSFNRESLRESGHLSGGSFDTADESMASSAMMSNGMSRAQTARSRYSKVSKASAQVIPITGESSKPTLVLTSVTSARLNPVPGSRPSMLNRLSEYERSTKMIKSHTKDSRTFKACVYVAISLNAIQMGLEVEFSENHWKTVFQVAEHFFTAIFLIEMMVMIHGLGVLGYFRDRWCDLDFIVVVTGVLQNWVFPLFGSDAVENLRIIGLLRLVRLTRILKLLKLKRELMLIVEGMASSMKSMVWLLLVLLVVMYVVAIFFVHTIGDSGAYPDEEDRVFTKFDPRTHFGTLIESMVTLFNMTLLVEWEDIVRPVKAHQTWLVPFLLVYVGMTSLGLMNAIIGVIVTRTDDASKKSDADRLREKKMQQMSTVQGIADIVYQLDANGDGDVTAKELYAAAMREDMMNCLQNVDLPYGFTVFDLHHMLDLNGDGDLTKDEFIQGMKRLVYSTDFHRMCLLQLASSRHKQKMYHMKQDLIAMKSYVEAVRKQHREEMQALSTTVARLRKEVAALPDKLADSGLLAKHPQAVLL